MKTTQLIRRGVVLIATIALSPFATAQTTITTTERPTVITSTGGERVVTTTTRVGRVGTVSPDTLVMESASGTEPVPYVRTTRTIYVDETGATVPVEMIRPGVPVTVHYSQDADRYVADRVIVQRQAVVRPAPSVVVEPARKPALIEKKTTTTTTIKEPAPVIVEKDDDDDDDDDD